MREGSSPRSSESSSTSATPVAAAAEPESALASSSRAPSKNVPQSAEVPFVRQNSPEALELVKAGSTSLRLRWLTPENLVSFEVEYRRTAWLVAATWQSQAVQPENVLHLDVGGSTELKLHSLEPVKAYDVRLIAVLQDGTRQISPAATYRTLALAPSLETPPCVQCARHDRLLLQWVGPACQADEVVAYKVRYYDCEPRWPVKHEVEAKLASRLLRPSEQTAQFLQGLAAMRVNPTASTGSAQGQADNAASPEEDGADGSLAHSGCTQVHFWLMNLAPSRMYYVQVAAVTAGGIGQWSPRSSPLFTWRVAPVLATPRHLFSTHSSVVLGQIQPLLQLAHIHHFVLDKLFKFSWLLV